MGIAKKLIDSLKEESRVKKVKVGPTYIKLVEFFPLKPIASKEEHELALMIIEKIITYNETIRDEGASLYLKTLADLVSDYERRRFKDAPVSGTDMLSYLMELQGLKQSDLAQIFGGQSVVSKVLKGERELNLRQIKALAKKFNVSAEVFI